MFIEEFETLERRVKILEEEFVNLLEIFTLTDDLKTLRAGAQMALEELRQRPAFAPDFQLEWEVGPDREVRFEPEEDDGA